MSYVSLPSGNPYWKGATHSPLLWTNGNLVPRVNFKPMFESMQNIRDVIHALDDEDKEYAKQYLGKDFNWNHHHPKETDKTENQPKEEIWRIFSI